MSDEKTEYWPEPTWALQVTQEQRDVGFFPFNHEMLQYVKDYTVNPLTEGWERRYTQSGIDWLKRFQLPRVTANTDSGQESKAQK